MEPLEERKVSLDGVGAYVWSSASLLGRKSYDARFWEPFRREAIDRILVSFDKSQIQLLGNGPARKRLLRFLESARSNRIKVELLLGEPTWILPRHRHELVEIILRFKDLPFEGLNLDLEPNQLDASGESIDKLIEELTATLQAAREVSPWPMGLTIHPRFMDPNSSGVCLGCALTKIGDGFREVVLMCYVTNPRRVADIVSPIMDAYPRLNFGVAQSVEPSLSEEESYAGRGRAHFRSKMQELRAALAGKPNFSGIVIQSWKDYEVLKP
jgi:hypothetical protein